MYIKDHRRLFFLNMASRLISCDGLRRRKKREDAGRLRGKDQEILGG